jgi:hypothetical protein
VVKYDYGHYTIASTVDTKIISSAQPEDAPATTLTSGRSCDGITVGNYNVENLSAKDETHTTDVARHIVNLLRNPDIVFLQEIQDNDGEESNNKGSY